MYQAPFLFHPFIIELTNHDSPPPPPPSLLRRRLQRVFKTRTVVLVIAHVFILLLLYLPLWLWFLFLLLVTAERYVPIAEYAYAPQSIQDV